MIGCKQRPTKPHPSRQWAVTVMGLLLWSVVGISNVCASPPTLVMEQVGQLQGPASDPMSQPTDVVVESSGTIWVLDGVNRRLARFSAKGQFERYVWLEKLSVQTPRPTPVPLPVSRPQPQTWKIISPPPDEAEEAVKARAKILPEPTPIQPERSKKAAPATPDDRLPVALGLDGEGHLLVGDRFRGAIAILDSAGNQVASVSIPRDPSERPADPTDIVPSPSGRSFFVADNDNHCVKEVDRNGQLLRRFGKAGSGPGEMQYPATLALTPKGFLLVTDVLNARVNLFDPSGQFARAIGSRGVVAGTFYRPKGIACDSAGRAHVSDSLTGLVQAFDLEGRLIGVWGTMTGQPHRLRAPATVCSAENGRFYVVEMLANRVSIWRERK